LLLARIEGFHAEHAIEGRHDTRKTGGLQDSELNQRPVVPYEAQD
jgi:hypothetical protein